MMDCCPLLRVRIGFTVQTILLKIADEIRQNITACNWLICWCWNRNITGKLRSIPRLLMSWLPVAPYKQQLWYWLSKVTWSSSYIRLRMIKVSMSFSVSWKINLVRQGLIRADYRLAPSQRETAYSRLTPSQWETSLQSNAVSHWLGANLESALFNEV